VRLLKVEHTFFKKYALFAQKVRTVHKLIFN